MKSLILMLSLLSSSVMAADYTPVKEKLCDGKKIEMLKDEKIMVDFQKGLMVFVQTLEDDCRVADVVMGLTPSRSDDGSGTFQKVQEAGRKSSCYKAITAYEGPQFEVADIQTDRVILQMTEGQCSQIEYLL